MRDRLIILIPAYEDWNALRLLLANISNALASCGDEVAVLIVDDASVSPVPQDLLGDCRSIQEALMVRLKSNLGHQRAIAVGLAYIQARLSCNRIVIMDADGEDRPEDIPRLLEESAEQGGGHVVFAERAARFESIGFRFFYWLYRLLFRIATGQRIRFGNFSLIPAGLLSRIVAIPDIWNNYAASIVKARLPLRTVSCDRGQRLVGKSKMGLVGLILHGLSAISVHSDVCGARALIASLLIMVGALGLGIVAAVIRLLTQLAIPGWATYAVGLSFLAVLQAVTLSAFFVFLILHGRNAPASSPGRDFAYFVGEVMELRRKQNGQS